MCNCKKSIQKSSGVKQVAKPSTTPVKKATSVRRPSAVKRVVVRRPL
jgi:hypothetical protein